MVSAAEVKLFCENNTLLFSSLCETVGGIDYHNMFVADYILSNPDRHDENWGFYMDNETGELVSMVPLYDHNLALISDIMGRNEDDSMLSNFEEFKTLKEGAEAHLKNSRIKYSDLGSVDFMEFEMVKEKVLKRLKYLKNLQ